jgi:hypothetical protein
MILRRITEHVKAQNWTAVAIDFVIVVVGVFIGIQVSNWNAARADRNREQVLIERVAADFEAIESRLSASATVFDNSLAAIDTVSQAITRADAPDTAHEIGAFGEALRQVLVSRVPAWRSATFVEMQSSGDLNLLRSAALKSALIRYDQQSGVAEMGWKLLIDRSLMYSAAIYDHVRFSARDGLLDGNESFEVASFDFPGLRADSRVLPALSVQTMVQANNRALQGQQLQRASLVSAALRQELAD